MMYLQFFIRPELDKAIKRYVTYYNNDSLHSIALISIFSLENLVQQRIYVQ